VFEYPYFLTKNLLSLFGVIRGCNRLAKTQKGTVQYY
jgi:hypothetical protein